MLNKVKSSSDWWELSNRIKNRKRTVRDVLSADDFYSHFRAVLQTANNNWAVSWCLPCNIDSILDSPIEMCELTSVLNSLKSNRAPGEDGISYEFYKNSPLSFVKEIQSVFNKIFLQEIIPSSFCKSILIPLYKKGDPNLATNYRGLSLIDTLCKIFTNIIYNRITEWIDNNNILNEYQAGFRKNYSTIDNIFNLVNIIELNRTAGNKVYAFFVDFSCAFDTIPRNCLFYKLSCLGLSSKIIRLLQLLYQNTTSRIRSGSTFSNPFPVDLGVKQGCILSPILFSLYMNDLADVLPGGVNVANTNVKVLLYADDIVILSDSPNGLQEMIDCLHRYCLTWSLRVNLDKSKIMIFRTGPRVSKNLRWQFGDEPVDIVNNYKYLGVEINYNLSFKKHLKNKLATAKLAINSTWSSYIKHPKISKSNKLKIFVTASTSIMFYASQVWGYKKYDDVEKLFKFFIKKMLRLPMNTPNYMLYLETGLDSLYTSTLKLHFTYINKVLQMDQNRLPRILAEHIITQNEMWAKEWSTLCSSLQYPRSNPDLPLSFEWKTLISALQARERNENICNARNSQFHDLYAQLNYNVMPSITSEYSTHATALLIRARGGLLDLNSKAFRPNSIGICTICNLDASENTYHFIGVCPMYNEYRLSYFKKTVLSTDEVIDILNGSNYPSLYKYIETSLKFRKLLLNEFNSY